jgi:hypothetical protein
LATEFVSFGWPVLGLLELLDLFTLVAARLGIPTILEKGRLERFSTFIKYLAKRSLRSW